MDVKQCIAMTQSIYIAKHEKEHESQEFDNLKLKLRLKYFYACTNSLQLCFVHNFLRLMVKAIHITNSYNTDIVGTLDHL